MPRNRNVSTLSLLPSNHSSILYCAVFSFSAMNLAEIKSVHPDFVDFRNRAFVAAMCDVIKKYIPVVRFMFHTEMLSHLRPHHCYLKCAPQTSSKLSSKCSRRSTQTELSHARSCCLAIFLSVPLMIVIFLSQTGSLFMFVYLFRFSILLSCPAFNLLMSFTPSLRPCVCSSFLIVSHSVMRSFTPSLMFHPLYPTLGPSISAGWPQLAEAARPLPGQQRHRNPVHAALPASGGAIHQDSGAHRKPHRRPAGAGAPEGVQRHT